MSYQLLNHLSRYPIRQQTDRWEINFHEYILNVYERTCRSELIYMKAHIDTPIYGTGQALPIRGKSLSSLDSNDFDPIPSGADRISFQGGEKHVSVRPRRGCSGRGLPNARYIQRILKKIL